MDILQISLIFLIILLSVFLSILGIQVFFILKGMKKALDKLNKVLKAGEEITQSIEKPVTAATNLVNTIQTGVTALTRTKKPPQKRFYKKI